MARLRNPKLIIPLILAYIFISVFGFSSALPEPIINNESGFITETEIGDYQPGQIPTVTKNNLLPVTYFSPVILSKNIPGKVKNQSTYFLLSIQKNIQYPSFKTLYLLIGVLIC